MALPLIPIVSTIGTLLGDVIDRAIPDKDLAAKAKMDAMSQLHTRGLAELEAATKTVVAEAQSDSWLAANWRPLTMLVFVVIIFSNYILSPWFGVPRLEIPPDMWDLLKIGIGGYVVSRGGEKIMREWRQTPVPQPKPRD